MKKYTLTHCVNNPTNHTETSWADFEKIMRDLNAREAIIFPIDDVFTEVSLVKRVLIGEGILKKDGVNFLDSFCLIAQEENGVILPCIILLNSELKYAVMKAVEFRENTFFIQCVITDDNQFKVGECEIVQADPKFNLMVN